MSAPLLEVRNLRVQAGPLEVVRGVDLTLRPGETLGIIGESGSGKTVTCLALLRLLPEGLKAEADVLVWRGRDLASLPDREFRPYRGREMAMVFQDPVGSFNPAKSIGWHLRTALDRLGAKGPWRPRAKALLADVGIPRPEAVLERYPHQLSGGMLQRALIAMVVALEPGLIATANALAARAEQLAEIPGQLPAPGARPSGCVFRPRCTWAQDGCEAPQPLREVGPGRQIRCLLDA